MEVILQADTPLSDSFAERAAACVGAPSYTRVDEGQVQLRATVPAAAQGGWRDALLALCQPQRADVAMLPQRRSLADYRLIVFDMDSTLINVECIDELAACVGRAAEVAALTDAAMRDPSIPYDDSLRARVRCLRGLPLADVHRTYEQRVAFNPGARELVAHARGLGLRTALVSGGFAEFAEPVRQALGIDYMVCNRLQAADGLLTGELVGTLINAREKANALQALCDQLHCPTADAIAVGDGSNDLGMMALAGVAVGYRAKPVVRQRAHVLIDHGSLQRLASMLGGQAASGRGTESR